MRRSSPLKNHCNRCRVRGTNRRLTCERLENRNLLAAYISELLVDPHFGDSDTTQMIELRGEPGAVLGDGTYLVVVDESSNNEGEVHGIFDLSNQAFGENGYLAILQKDSPHVPDPAANVLQSTEKAFGGLPDGIYTDSHPISNRIDFIIGANTYMLIQTDFAPALEFDIDVDDDGLIDPLVLSAWNVLDSISLHPSVGRGNIAYGDIVFAEIGSSDPAVAVREGVSMIPTEGFGFAARVGESTGSEPTDWIAGTIQDELSGPENNRWAFVDNLFGTPSQYEFSGRDLDHVGGPNFVGGVHGHIHNNLTNEPITGAMVFADTDENGSRDVLTHIVDPDDLVGEDDPENRKYPLLNAFPGVTVTNFALGSYSSGEVTGEKESAFPNELENRIFATGGFDWFTKSGALRFDFYEPVREVSITAIGPDSSLSKIYGRLNAFNAVGDLIDTDVSGLLGESQRAIVSVSSDTDDIAYVMAYADQEIEDGSGQPWARFDHLEYSQLEPYTISDDNGDYYLTNLFAGEYKLRVAEASLIGEGRDIEVVKYNHFTQDFTLGANAAPRITEAEFTISENIVGGEFVGTVVAEDPDEEAVTYRFGLNAPEQFVIDAESGAITTATDAVFDFETKSVFEFQVIASDPAGAEAGAGFKIRLENANEAPTLENRTIAIAENTEVGSKVAELESVDPDEGQTITYQIVGGSGQSFFEIGPNTGNVELKAGLDFEEASLLVINVMVADNGDPSLSTIAEIRFEIGNTNEPPILESTAFSISESAEVGTTVGTLSATDPDLGQSVGYEIVGGNGQELFEIGAENGVIKLHEPLDFEQADQWTIEVKATDNGEPAASTIAEVRIEVGNQNESPTFETAEWSISETAADGTALGTLEASDPEASDPSSEQSLSYEIVGGSGRELFAIDSDSGRATLTGDLDFESQNELALEIRVSDSGVPTGSFVGSVFVTVLDENEAPTLVGDEWSIDETAELETQAGRAEADDPDAEQTLTYAITGGSGQELFTINAETGVVRLAETLEVDEDRTYTLDISATDNGEPELSTSATFEVLVRNGNETPIIDDALWSIDEAALPGSEVATVIATDADSDQTLTYAITGGSGQELFQIADQSGLVTVVEGATFDFETRDEYSLVIEVTDSGSPAQTAIKEFVVEITNVDEAPVFDADVADSEAMTGEEFVLDLPDGLVIDPDGESQWDLLSRDLPNWLKFDPAAMRFHGIPTSFFIGPMDVNLEVADRDDANLYSSITFTITIQRSATPLHNVAMPQDVNGDNLVTARDALGIINYLAAQDSEEQIGEDVRLDAFLDVSGNNRVSTNDALQVINEIARLDTVVVPEPLTAGPNDANEIISPGPIDSDASRNFIETESGLRYRILRASDGITPTALDSVEVHYKGWLDDGTIFDSSYRRGEKIAFPLNRVIAGWTEGMQLVGEGGMIELEIPSALGYGENGAPPVVPSNATLHFVVELFDVQFR